MWYQRHFVTFTSYTNMLWSLCNQQKCTCSNVNVATYNKIASWKHAIIIIPYCRWSALFIEL